MKHKFLERAASTALGLGIASVAAVALYLIANRLFGVFNYPELSPDEVDRVARKYLSRDVITKADGPNYSRGVISMGGTLYYFKWIYGVSFEIFELVLPERYSTDNILIGAPKLVLPV